MKARVINSKTTLIEVLKDRNSKGGSIGSKPSMQDNSLTSPRLKRETTLL